jgi:hypothetical protein
MGNKPISKQACQFERSREPFSEKLIRLKIGLKSQFIFQASVSVRAKSRTFLNALSN